MKFIFQETNLQELLVRLVELVGHKFVKMVAKEWQQLQQERAQRLWLQKN